MKSDCGALNSNWFMNRFPVCTWTWLTWELAKKHEPIHMLIQIASYRAGATGRNITTWGQQMWDMMWTTGPKGWYVCAQKTSHAKLSKAPTWTAMPSVGVLRSLACKLGDIKPSAIVMLHSGLLYFTVRSCVFFVSWNGLLQTRVLLLYQIDWCFVYWLLPEEIASVR